MNCEFCNNVFSSISILNTHKKTAKYCLKLRDIEKEEYKCESCTKIFSTKTNLNRHQQTCKVGYVISDNLNIITTLKNSLYEYKIKLQEKDETISQKDETISQKDDQIRDLQNKLENIAISAVSRPTTSNKTQINNYIQQMKPVTDEYMEDNVKHLTIDHIMKGAEGYAQYALEYPLKDRLICVDYARRKVKFKNNEGELITDPEMSNLATKFFNSIKDKNKELIIECGKKLKENFGDELDTIVKIFDYKTGVERSSDGEKSEFHHDFVRQVCSRTIKE
jgi:hypothetical protein